MDQNYYGNSGDVYDHAGRPSEPDDPEPMTVFAIVQYPHGGLGVELASATEMSFDLHLKPGDDYDRAIADLCALAPVLLRLDIDLMESADDGGRTKPRRKDLLEVEAFVNRWRSRIKNCNVAAGAFARLMR